MKKKMMIKEELSEDYCFACKDGGHLRVCDFKNCLKAYHPECVGKDPSFMETNERWTCGRHSCFICQKASTFQCYCCPSSVCRSCIKEAEFVQVKKRTKGFCNNCLRIATLIEENIDVDSDGGKVDFRDTETYEFLFKEYWEIIKDQEGLTLVDLQEANALLKSGENFKGGSDSDGPLEEDVGSEVDELEDDLDDGLSFLEYMKGKRGRIKKSLKRSRSRKKMFIGWGSAELINFLTSIGKDTNEPLTQLDACEIIKDYIQANNLHDPDAKKKKIVICDERLHALFRKRRVKFHKIYSLLESHFTPNDDSDDKFSSSSEEDGDAFGRRKKRNTASHGKFHKSHSKNLKENFSAPPKSPHASIIGKNINSVYLKRSLIMELLKSPDTFEGKVTGCFVRIKIDPKDLYSTPEKMYKLGQVTGVNKALQTYNIGEMSTDTVLRVSDMHKDVQISMLSEDDFEEDECEDLRKLANKGLFRRPTVAELEEKIRSVHADIMNHWIDKEIVKLQKLIDRANEKGWRKELFDYIDKREKLRTSEERQRLLQEIPPVIADTCEIEANTDSPPDSPAEKKECKPLKATEVDMTSSSRIIEIEEDGEVPTSNITSKIQIIDLFEDEDRI